MDTIVKTTSRILFPFILVFGIYITLHGHLSPGGGFSGGAIIATGFVLLVIAYKEQRVEYRFHEISFIDAKTIAAFGLLIIVLFGLFLKMELIQTQNIWKLWGGGLAFPSNILGTILVTTALVIIIYAIVKE